jgi:hypothetical protein
MTFDPDEDIAWVIMHRLTWQNVDLMPDSVVVIANCGHRAWQAPSSTSFLAEDPVGRGAYTICTSCVSPEMLAEVMTQGRWSAVPGAADEFERAIGTANADQVMAFLASMGIREWRNDEA